MTKSDLTLTVAELIEQLKRLPPECKVAGAYDGAARMNVTVAYLSRDGEAILASRGEVIYRTGDRPLTAPTEEAEPYWTVE